MMALLLTIWAAILVADDTPIGRFLRTLFVVRPAAWLDRIGRGHIVLALLLLLIGFAALEAGGEDAVRMMGTATPDLFVWATSFEVASLADLAIAMTLVASTLRPKSLWAALRMRCRRAPVAASRRRRRMRPRSPANDDDDGRRLAAA